LASGLKLRPPQADVGEPPAPFRSEAEEPDKQAKDAHSACS
jgi:hypothetical protein